MYNLTHINEHIICFLNDMYHLTCYTFSFTSTKQNTLYIKTDIKNIQLTLDQFFYQVLIQSTFNEKNKDNSNDDNDDNHVQDVLASNQHQLLVPKRMNCTPRYQVDYAYAQGMLIMHKPWNKHNRLEHILDNKAATIDMFLRMIDRKEVPLSVTFQYLTAMKHAQQKK